VHFSGTVVGVADANEKIDLADINFATLLTPTYSSSTGSGTLTVTDGIHTAHLALLGNYVAGNFKTVNDGADGVLIADVPIPPPGQSKPAMPIHSSG